VHTLRFEPGVEKGKEGGSFLHIRVISWSGSQPGQAMTACAQDELAY